MGHADNMAVSLFCCIKKYKFIQLPIAINECTDIINTSQLTIFIHGIDDYTKSPDNTLKMEYIQ